MPNMKGSSKYNTKANKTVDSRATARESPRTSTKNMNIKIAKEIHTFLWAKPQINNGVYDGGWNCRDHAIVSAGLLLLEGKRVNLCEGKNMIVRGPIGDTPPVGYGQASERSDGRHGWVSTGDGLVTDYSMSTPSPEQGKGWKGVLNPFIEDSVCSNNSGAEIILTHSQFEYDNEINKSTHLNNRLFVIYFLESASPPSLETFANPFIWINSPLSKKMKSRFSNGIYIKIIMHLYDLSRGNTKSLSDKSRIAAWSCVNKRSGDELSRFQALLKNQIPNKSERST
jgi:hypothetical protein